MVGKTLAEAAKKAGIEKAGATLDAVIAELETTRQSERAGRAMDHEAEDSFERLRRAGYM